MTPDGASPGAERPTARASLARARDGLLLAGALIAVLLGARLASPGSTAAPGPSASASASASEDAAPAPPAPVASARYATLNLTPRDCSFEDRGIGDYVRAKTRGGASVLARAAALSPDGDYDLVLHFHGVIPVERVLGPAAQPVVIASLDRGDSSRDYQGTFADAAAFDGALAEIDAAVGAALGRPARATRVLLSSFSAGYRALYEALSVAPEHAAVRGVALLDSLYGSYRGGAREVDAEGLAPFEAAAKRALTQPRFTFFLSHSEVATDGYATTAEVATTLLDRLVVRSSLVKTGAARGLTRTAEERGLVVRGYAGGDKGAHCAHLGLLPEVVELWRSKL